MQRHKLEDCVTVVNKMGRKVLVSKKKAKYMVLNDSAKIVETVKELKDMTKKELLIECIKKDIVADAKSTKAELLTLLK